MTVSCDADFRECAEPDVVQAGAPEKLSETGLFADIASDALAPDVMRYTPSFALWSDGATKRRFIWLPPDTSIDTSDPDAWQFPVGTKLWKEFTRDGVRVETRLLQRTGPAEDAWLMLAYVWNDAGDDAVRTPAGMSNARGTPHDVPSARVCVGCHGGRPGRVLGFSAIQLAHEAASGEVALAELQEQQRFTRPLPRTPRVPGTSEQVAGLGYLHANCSHCHNQSRPNSSGPRCYDPEKEFEFLLHVSDQRVADTAAYRTAGDVFDGDDPDRSKVIRRMSRRDGEQMPPLATELVDTDGVARVRTLIESLR